MKLCYVYLQPIRKGKEDFAAIVPIRMAQLMGEDFQIHVIYGGCLNEDLLRARGVTCHRLPTLATRSPFLYVLSVAAWVAKVGKQAQIEVFMNVWAHYLLFPVSIGALICKARVVARVAGIPIKVSTDARGIRRCRNTIGLAVERLSLKIADHIHVLSNSLADVFEKRGVPRRRMTVISQGCDTSLFGFRPKPRLVEEQTKRLLYVGRITPAKGLDSLFLAVLKMRKERRLQLRIVGGGEAGVVDHYKAFVAEHGLLEDVIFCGHNNHDILHRHYEQADVFILPSRSEGLPNVVLEAMAVGVPCVATAVGEIPVLFEEDRGLLVEVDEPDALAAKVMQVLSNAGDTRLMVERARAYIEREHSFGSVRAKYVNLFECVAMRYGCSHR